MTVVNLVHGEQDKALAVFGSALTHCIEPRLVRVQRTRSRDLSIETHLMVCFSHAGAFSLLVDVHSIEQGSRNHRNGAGTLMLKSRLLSGVKGGCSSVYRKTIDIC